MFDADEIIAKQTTSAAPAPVALATGECLTLLPARFLPALDAADRRLTLNGPWRVMRWPFDRHEADLTRPRLDDTGWQTLDQPGKIFYQDPGICPSDNPNWNRVRLDHIDEADGAVLRRQVRIPEGWAGKRVLLRFGAIYPAGRVYLNGELLGEQASGLTPVEWDVTGRAAPGETALVAVRLLRKHKYVDLDMPRHGMEFAGLAQEAYFHAVEELHLADYHLPAELDAGSGAGSIAGSVTLANASPDARAAALTVTVTDPSGAEVARASRELAVPAGGTAEAAVRIDLPAVKPWNDEQPDLYAVTIHLASPGQADQRAGHRAGFRRLDLSPDGPRLNGRFIKFRGVNHLTFHPELGLHTPADWLRRCLTLMKRANVNAIRTHYLSPPALADLCDEMGFYLMQELPIDWASHHVSGVECIPAVLHRIEAGVRRDRHHPSVVVWSIGNENLPTGPEVEDVFWANMRLFERLAKTLAPTTATMFPPPGPANKIDGIFETRVGDIADTHYSFTYARQLRETGQTAEPRSWLGDYTPRTRDELLARGWSGVWFSSEWGLFNYQPDLLNAPYLSIIADRMEDPLSGKNTQQAFIDRFDDDWSVMRDDPTCLGGAYFPWMCAGSGELWGWTLWGEDADWGVVTHDLLPKPAFWAMRVAYSPVQLPARVTWRPGQTELRLAVRNMHNGVDLSRYTFRTMMGGGAPWLGSMRTWRDIPIACPPGETIELTVPIWNDETLRALQSGSPVVCRCIPIDPSGYRPITADVLVVPEALAGADDAPMPIGPDAEL